MTLREPNNTPEKNKGGRPPATPQVKMEKFLASLSDSERAELEGAAGAPVPAGPTSPLLVQPESASTLPAEKYEGGPTRLMIFNHPLFFDDPGTTANALNGHAFAIDFNDFGMTTQRATSTTGFFRWRSNVQTPGDLKIEEQLIVDFGFDYALLEHYGRAFNVGA